TCIRDFIHVSDLVRAHLLVLRHLRRRGGNLVLNCGYGRGFSVLEVLESIRRVSGAPVPAWFEGRRSGDAAAVVADPARLCAMLGWQPRFDDLDRICADALRWERALSAYSSAAG